MPLHRFYNVPWNFPVVYCKYAVIFLTAPSCFHSPRHDFLSFCSACDVTIWMLLCCYLWCYELNQLLHHGRPTQTLTLATQWSCLHPSSSSCHTINDIDHCGPPSYVNRNSSVLVPVRGVGSGVCPSPIGRSLKRGSAPPQKRSHFSCRNGAFWCILANVFKLV